MIILIHLPWPEWAAPSPPSDNSTGYACLLDGPTLRMHLPSGRDDLNTSQVLAGSFNLLHPPTTPLQAAAGLDIWYLRSLRTVTAQSGAA
jgi:hypothetical protein